MTQIQALNWLGIRSLKSRNSELKSPLLAMIQPGFVVAKFPNNPVTTSEGSDIRQPPQEARKSPEISASGGGTSQIRIFHKSLNFNLADGFREGAGG